MIFINKHDMHTYLCVCVQKNLSKFLEVVELTSTHFFVWERIVAQNLFCQKWRVSLLLFDVPHNAVFL